MPYARLTDPQTSHQAAVSVKDPSRTQAHIMHLFFAFGPMDDTTLCDRYHMQAFKLHWPRATDQSVRSRRAELTHLGHLEDSGQRVVLPSNRKAVVWRLAPSAPVTA